MKAKEIGVKFSKLPIWVFHGDEDEIVSVEVSRKFVKALQDAGGNPKYTEYKGVGHDSWSLAYRDNELILDTPDATELVDENLELYMAFKRSRMVNGIPAILAYFFILFKLFLVFVPNEILL